MYRALLKGPTPTRAFLFTIRYIVPSPVYGKITKSVCSATCLSFFIKSLWMYIHYIKKNMLLRAETLSVHLLLYRSFNPIDRWYYRLCRFHTRRWWDLVSTYIPIIINWLTFGLLRQWKAVRALKRDRAHGKCFPLIWCMGVCLNHQISHRLWPTTETKVVTSNIKYWEMFRPLKFEVNVGQLL